MTNRLARPHALFVFLLFGWIASLSTLPPSAAYAQDTTEVSAPDGLWLGEAEHYGQRHRMLLEFAEHPEAGRIVRLSLPDLLLWDVAALPVQTEGSKVTLGPWTLELQDDGTLAGHLPDFFVPVHRIPITFRSVEAFERATSQPIDAPRAEAVWTRDLDAAVWAGIGARDDLIYVGDDTGRLYALAIDTGESRWSFATDGAIRARPSLIDDTLYLHSDDGHLYALDPTSGEERWRAHLGDVDRIPLGAEGARYNHFASGVAAAPERLFVGTFAGEIVALDRAGREIWRAASEDSIPGTPVYADGRLFFGSFDGHVYALDAASGEELWRHDTGAPVVSSPAVHDGLVVVGSRSYDLVALDVASGEPAWTYYYWFSWIESSVTERDGIGYVGSSDGQELLAVELASGEPRWTFDTRGSAWPQPAVSEDGVFIGTVGVADYWAGHEGAFLAVERASGEARWIFPMARPEGASTWGFAASPVVAGDLVFAADLSGRVYAFRQAN